MKSMTITSCLSVLTAAAVAAPLPQPDFSISPPACLYEPDWNMACVIVRGAGVGGEMGEVKAIVDGTVLKLR